MTFRKIDQVHFVGIGGIGMSGIAELLLNLGFTVTGSDMNNSDNVQRLVNLGIDVKIGHDLRIHVYSSRIRILSIQNKNG